MRGESIQGERGARGESDETGDARRDERSGEMAKRGPLTPCPSAD
jgi:hypothetical protein